MRGMAALLMSLKFLSRDHFRARDPRRAVSKFSLQRGVARRYVGQLLVDTLMANVRFAPDSDRMADVASQHRK